MTLKRTIFFPYPFEEDVLSTEVLKLTVDGRERKGYVNPETRLVSLNDLHGWKEAEVELRCTAPEGLAQKVLPANEWEAPQWRCDVIGLCGPTRWRNAAELKGPAEGPWTGTVKLRRDELHGVARLTATLTRAKDAIRRGDFAVRQGARLATAPQWQVRIDEPNATAGKYLRVLWDDFGKSEIEALANNAEQVYFLELNAPSGGPILWLNSGIEDLQSVLDSKATHGRRAAARNALFDSIAQPVWLSLVVGAANALSDEEEDADQEEEATATGWERSVLELIAPEVFPDEGTDEAVKNLVQGLARKDQHQDVLQRLTLALQRHLTLQKSTLSLLKAVEEEG